MGIRDLLCDAGAQEILICKCSMYAKNGNEGLAFAGAYEDCANALEMLLDRARSRILLGFVGNAVRYFHPVDSIVPGKDSFLSDGDCRAPIVSSA